MPVERTNPTVAPKKEDYPLGVIVKIISEKTGEELFRLTVRDSYWKDSEDLSYRVARTIYEDHGDSKERRPIYDYVDGCVTEDGQRKVVDGDVLWVTPEDLPPK